MVPALCDPSGDELPILRDHFDLEFSGLNC